VLYKNIDTDQGNTANLPTNEVLMADVPGVDNDTDAVWPRQEEYDESGWYGRLVVPIARSWTWCKQSHNHAIDLFRASGQGELAYNAKQVFNDNKARYHFLTNQVNPKRINDGHWQRFALHISELKKIGERYGESFGDAVNVMKNLKTKYTFCEDIDEDLMFIENYGNHVRYLESIAENA